MHIHKHTHALITLLCYFYSYVYMGEPKPVMMTNLLLQCSEKKSITLHAPVGRSVLRVNSPESLFSS